MVHALLSAGLLAATLAAPPQNPPSDRLYGRVETVRGDVHVGFIRWGRGAGAWADVLTGSKGISEENQRQVRRLRAEAEPQGDRAGRSVVYNGILITWDEDDSEIVPDTAQSGIRFGQVLSVTRMDETVARLELRNGSLVELTNPNRRSPFVDTIVVESESGAEVGVPWGDVITATFETAPPGRTTRDVRLHGTVRLRGGDTFTGYLSFDGRRIFTRHVLTGREGDAERRIPFSDVQTVAWAEGPTARVTLATGETVALANARSGNSLRVVDPSFGSVTFSLNRVEEIRLHPPAAPATLDLFATPQRLRGTVTRHDGQRFSGFIRWDNDEESSWEILDGSEGGLTFTVELSNVRSIQVRDRRRAIVTLRDGRELELTGSNDVGTGNKGVVIEQDDGTFRFVDWLMLDSLELEGP